MESSALSLRPSTNRQLTSAANSYPVVPVTGQPVRLFVEQPIERIETARLAGDTVELRDARVDETADRFARRGERAKPPLHDFLLARAERDQVRIACAARRKLGGRGEHDFQL